MSGEMPFPVWMTAVNDKIIDIANRMRMAGCVVPPLPTPMGTAYALYGGIDPAIAAVLIMKDAIEMHRRVAML